MFKVNRVLKGFGGSGQEGSDTYRTELFCFMYEASEENKSAVVTTAFQCPETEGHRLITQVKVDFSLGGKSHCNSGSFSPLAFVVYITPFRSPSTTDMVP